MVGQYVTMNDDVVSHLNISSVKDEDGGEYSCTAGNSIAHVTHTARINVFGKYLCCLLSLAVLKIKITNLHSAMY